MNLTGKQKRELKAQGHKLPDAAHLGKAGLTDTFIEHVNGLLDRKELIKLRFSDVTGADRKLLADEVSLATNAQCISIVGRTFLLYRPNPHLDDDKRITL